MEEYEIYTPDLPYSDDLIPQEPGLQPSDSGNGKKDKNPNKNERSKKRPKKKPEDPSKKREPSVKTSAIVDRLKAFFTAENFKLILGMIAGGFGCWLLIAFISYLSSCIVDQSLINNSEIGFAPPVSNYAGEGGARISEFLINETFGLGSVVIVIWLLAMAFKLLAGWPNFKTVNFSIKCIIALITLSLIIGLSTIALDTPVNWGGYHGRYVNEFIVSFIGWSGAGLVSLIMVGIFVLICLRDLIKWIIRMRKKIAAEKQEVAARKAEYKRLQDALEKMRLREAEDAAKAGEGVDLKIGDSGEISDVPVSFDTPKGSDNYTLPDLDDYYEKKAPSGRQQEAGNEEPSVNDKEEISSDDGITANEAIEEPKGNTGSGDINEPSNISGSQDIIASEENGVPAEADDTSDFDEPHNASEGSSDKETVPDKDGSAANNGRYEPRVYSFQSSGSRNGEKQEKRAPREKKLRPLELENPSANGPMVVNVNHVVTAKSLDASRSDSIYRFPSIELLKPGVAKISVDADEQLENKEKIRKTLLDFDIPIVSIEATVGPTITLYEIRPERGVKISKIRSLVDDIALSLSAIGVRIIAPIPGRGTVGIEVANKDPQTVSMRTIITSQKYQQSKAKLPVAIGSTISNDVYIADLTKMPHLLVAGATGQGKSVGLNAIIASLLYCRKPSELKFVMIDPKQVEFSLYSKIEKHYLAKIPDTDDAIITDMSQVVATLNSLCVEMDDRYQKLKQAQVRNLEEYNEKVSKGTMDPTQDHHFLPYIVLVVDEFADLIMTAGKEVEMPIARLAQKARAVGMHVIIATQRPSTNVITGIIKANFPVRIAFKVSSGIDSKTILDTPGAQLLIGRGDMLISNNSEMVRVQCAFIDTPEVEAICNHICNEPGGGGAYILPDPPSAGGEGADAGSGDFSGGLDPLFEECARLVVLNNTASTSSLQRRYSIGYNRAGKIMDQLEKAGIVGPSTGGKPRNVLTDSVGLEAILEQFIH